MSWQFYKSNHPRYATYVVAMMTTLGVFNTLDRTIVSILVEPIKADLKLSDTDLGIIMGIGFSLMYAICAFPLARLADRGNRRKILASILAIWSLATALCGAAQSAWQLVVCRMVMAGGESGQMPIGQSLVADYVPPAARARAIGWIGAGTALGSVLGLSMGGVLAQAVGWRWTFAVVGLPGVFLALVVFATIREPREGGTGAVSARQIPPFLATISLLLRQRSFILLTLSITLCTLPTSSVTLWNPAVMMRKFAIPVGQAGFYLGLIAGTAGMLGMVLGGYLGQRGGGGWRGLTWPMLGMVVAGPLFMLAYHAPTFAASAALLIIPSVIGGIWYPPLYAAIQNVVTNETRAIAVATAAFFSSVIGLGLGPTTVGFLSDAFAATHGKDSLRMAVMVVANMTFLAAGALYLARRELARCEKLAAATR